jgi:hypothetical protein
MRIPAVATILTISVLAACGSAQAPRPTRERILAVTDQGVIRAYDEPNEQPLVLEISADSAFTLLAAAYEEIGVDVTMRDMRTHEIGNRNFSKYYRLGETPLSTYLGCGDTMSGPAADRRRVAMSLTSTVTEESGGAVIRSVLKARAEEPEFSTWASCLTTGVLERRINELVELKNAH